MRLCEILMADGPRKPGSSWQELDFSWYVLLQTTHTHILSLSSNRSTNNHQRGWAWVPVWSQLEVDIGIVAATLPCLSPLFKQVFFSNNRACTPSKIPTLPGYDKSWRSKELVSDDDDDSILEKGDWRSAAVGKEVDVEKGFTVTVTECETRPSTDSDVSRQGDDDTRPHPPRKSIYYDNGLSDIAEEDCSNRSSLGSARQIEVKTLAATGRPKLVEYKIT